MAQTNVRAARFADAAFGVARQEDQIDAWQQALGRAAALFEDRGAARLLTSPVISPSRKKAALDELLPGLPPMVHNFLDILAQRDKLDLIPEIARAFGRLVNEHRGIRIARVTTAIPLDEHQQELIGTRLAERIGKKVTLETHVDPTILGGVIAQIGDDVIDGSVRGRLERMRRSLMA